MKAAIYTLGCKVNTYESEYIISLLKTAGFEIVDFNDQADFYIINTCSVTNSSDVKSRKMIRNASKRGTVIALGCYVQSSIDDLIEEIDIAIDNSHKGDIVELIKEYQNNPKRLIKTRKKIDSIFEDMYLDSFETRTRAFIKIQDGCDNFCSYCIIPFTRGKPRSKKPEIVIKEIKNLVASGYKEVVLTGIHTGHYGRDLDTSFTDLLKELEKIDGLERIRISSVEITELNDDFLNHLKTSKKITDHIHIPLQSGSDTVLKVMNRKYDTKYFKEKIEKLRKIKPGIAITTDLIVGHPYEEEKEFNETKLFLWEIAFAKIHVFPYSRRAHTKSSRMPQVNGNIKKQRVRDIINISKELEIKYFRNYLGKELEFLIEKYDGKYSYGHSSNFLYMKTAKEFKESEIVKLRVKDVKYPYVLCE